MRNTKDTKKIIPYEVIAPATGGDVIAMTYVMKHFESYLNQLSRKVLFDGKGSTYKYIDPDIRRQLEMKLMLSILKFETNIV